MEERKGVHYFCVIAKLRDFRAVAMTISTPATNLDKLTCFIINFWQPDSDNAEVMPLTLTSFSNYIKFYRSYKLLLIINFYVYYI